MMMKSTFAAGTLSASMSRTMFSEDKGGGVLMLRAPFTYLAVPTSSTTVRSPSHPRTFDQRISRFSNFDFWSRVYVPSMKLTKRGEYALRALIDFGIAHELGRPLMTVGELVEKERLPVKFLEQILSQLRQGGYISTKRGKKGGYFLAKPPNEIRFGQVIRLIDGPLAPIGCVSQMAYERCTCPDEDHCGLRMLMMDVRNAIARILDRYVLADVVEITLRKMRRDGVPIPWMAEAILHPSAQRSIYREGGHPLGSFLAELEGGGMSDGDEKPFEAELNRERPRKRAR